MKIKDESVLSFYSKKDIVQKITNIYQITIVLLLNEGFKFWFFQKKSLIGNIIWLFEIVQAKNETVGLNLTWAHNLFVRWASRFPILGHSRHRDSK